MINEYPPQVSVIVPTYNPDPDELRETLLSLANQTLAKSLFEVIVVDDGSNDDEALGAANEIRESFIDEHLAIRFIKHDENKWLASARTTGAQASEAEFVVFLDDNDYLKRDYLEKCMLLLLASPEYNWVYTSQRMFGQRNELKLAGEFKPFQLFVHHSMSYSSMFRREAWLRVGQRQQFITNGIRQFEDWDMYIRMVSKGMLGTPLNDTVFNSRKSPSGLAVRSVREHLLSMYKMLRQHFPKLLLLPLASLKQRSANRIGYGQLSVLNPARHLNAFCQYLAIRYMGLREAPVQINLSAWFMAIFTPNKFSRELLDNTHFMSIASTKSGFKSWTDMSFTRTRTLPSVSATNTVLAGHIWWQMGGAENIFHQWMSACSDAGANKIIDLVSFDDANTGVLKSKFATVSDTQYNLSAFGQTPAQRLRVLWNLILLERPSLIFISSSSYLYQLCPYIKEEFPDIKIIDILHNEFDGMIDWYTASADFQQYIDKRIVTSEYWKEVLIQKYKTNENKIVVSRNPVDTALFDPSLYSRKKVIRSFKLDPKKKIISFAGRLHPQKGLDVFLKLAEIMVTDREFHFVIVGDGELRSMVEDKIKSLNNLSYLGYLPSVEKILAMTDVLICPSLYEGAPLIGLEAAAMNTPVLAPDAIGFREQIDEGRFGILYEASLELQNDITTLRNMLMTNYDELVELGKNGREFVNKYHAIDVVQSEYVNELKEFFNE